MHKFNLFLVYLLIYLQIINIARFEKMKLRNIILFFLNCILYYILIFYVIF